MYVTERPEGNVSIVKCANCGHIYQNPRLSDEEIKKSYQKKKDFYRSLPREKNLPSLNMVNNKRIEKIEKITKGRILDIGCAFGNLLSVAKYRDWDAYGVEISSHMANVAKKHGNIFLGTLERARYKKDFFDAITMFDVLEHVTDPENTLKECNRIMKNGGVLVIQTPAIDSMYAKIKSKNWDYYGLQHLNYFSLSDMKKILKKTGFMIKKIYYGDEIGFCTNTKAYLMNKNNDRLSAIKFIFIQLLRRVHIGNISFGSKVYYVTKA
jgi:2-polyprenyl-3-methyl-5-hydroxy-6-metoxy-1,4-benzoquinol methylase